MGIVAQLRGVKYEKIRRFTGDGWSYGYHPQGELPREFRLSTAVHAVVDSLFDDRGPDEYSNLMSSDVATVREAFANCEVSDQDVEQDVPF